MTCVPVAVVIPGAEGGWVPRVLVMANVPISPHQALDALSYVLLKKKVNYVLDADIRGFR